MSLPSAQRNVDSVDYAALRALVVDDYPGIRSALRLTLSNFGVTKVQLVSNAAEAIYQVKQSQFDFILCDFNLGDGRDGQQLLEELRHSQLISVKTVFMMVTAESYYENVAATAELAPDDSMIKPFSAELLRGRLEGILLKKRGNIMKRMDFCAGHTRTACGLGTSTRTACGLGIYAPKGGARGVRRQHSWLYGNDAQPVRRWCLPVWADCHAEKYAVSCCTISDSRH